MSTDSEPTPASTALFVGRMALFALAALVLFGFGDHFGLWHRAGFVQAMLSVCAALLAVASATARGRTAHGSRLVVVGLVLVAVGAMNVQAGGRLSKIGKPAQLGNWGIYHYYLGSKYFDELEYTELYRETLKADAEGPNKFSVVPKIRNLTTYKREKSDDFRHAPRHERWTDERWEEFRQDVWYIGGLRIAKDWNKILGDRGYNPPPSYTLVAGFINNRFSVRTPTGQTILALLDLLVILVAFGVSIFAYGLKRSLLVLIGYILWFGNWGRIYGQFWINDWFAACWAAVAFYRMERFRWAGALAAYATAVRVFPGVLFVGPVVAALPSILRTRRVPRSLVRFIAVGAVTGLLLVSLSALRYSPRAWTDFAGNIVTHSENHEGGLRRVGLKHLSALDWQNGLETSATKVDVRKNMRENAGLHRAAMGVFLVLLLIAMARSEPHDAMLIALGIMFVATVASRYYGAVFALWLLLRAQRARAPDPEARWLGDLPTLRSPKWVAMDVAFFGIFVLFYAAPIASKFPRVEYMWGNAGVLAFLLLVLGLTAFAPLSAAAPTEHAEQPE
jgi:hypothetical protein